VAPTRPSIQRQRILAGKSLAASDASAVSGGAGWAPGAAADGFASRRIAIIFVNVVIRYFS
jgi:hypothetical protein